MAGMGKGEGRGETVRKDMDRRKRKRGWRWEVGVEGREKGGWGGGGKHLLREGETGIRGKGKTELYHA